MRFKDYFNLILEEEIKNFARDEEYMAAVKSGNTAKQQSMVDSAAKDAGYTIGPLYHGSPVKGFDNFDTTLPSRKKTIGKAIFMSSSEDFAGYFTKDESTEEWPGEVRKFYVSGNFESIPEDVAKLGDKNEQEILNSAKMRGFDGVIFLQPDWDFEDQGDNYAILNPNLIKSADPITIDKLGNIIPLSQRFDHSQNSIFY